MAVEPHDIIKVSKVAQELRLADLPPWTHQSWARSPFHVVRRAPMVAGTIPIGIRGQSRGERCAIDISQNWVESIITPQSLVKKKCWQGWQRQDEFPHIVEILNQLSAELHDYHWGIGGSLGYELTANIPTLRPTSDIDLILYQGATLTHEESARIIQLTSKRPISIDIQVQNRQGAFHLQEYVQAPDSAILLKTEHGPVLTKNVWMI